MGAAAEGVPNPGNKVGVIVLIGMVLVALIIGVLIGWWLSASAISALAADRAADRQKTIDASANLLGAVLQKLANVSGHKQTEKGIAILGDAHDIFTTAASLRSIAFQNFSLCNAMSNTTFHDLQMPPNVTANYSASCSKYPPLLKEVDPFRRGEISITGFMTTVEDLLTALMKLDNAIVGDP